MSDIAWVVIALGGMVILLAAGIEIAWSLGIVAVVVLVWLANQPFDQLMWTSWRATNSYTLTALPLFVFMGAILSNSGVTETLFSGVEKWLDRLPGSLACATLAANAIFAAMSGSGSSAAATFSKIAFPAMESRGYSPKLSLPSIAMGATLAPLIPPSLLLIIYGTWQSVPVMSLFAAAIIPGITLAVMLVITVIIRVKLSPNLAPPMARYSWRVKLAALKGIFPFLLVVFGVLGSIFLGVMTPTEAAALGAFLSIVLSLAYRRLNRAILQASLLDAARVTSFALFIYAMAVGLTYGLNMLGIVGEMTGLILGLPIGKYGTIVLFIIGYLILGCFLGAWEMLFLTFPFIMPVIVAHNINLVWWGIIYVIIGDVGNVTPPFGLTLFVIRGILGSKYSIETIALDCIPFFIPSLVLVALMIFFPEIALWLPGIFMK
ncbi:MAG: TRAP transporter large permease subunit [Chloroflexi bacterium]|nr:TRAP transporter large permease subunit [Chloroflexota bacterium]